jgi:hypothetical protein
VESLNVLAQGPDGARQLALHGRSHRSESADAPGDDRRRGPSRPVSPMPATRWSASIIVSVPWNNGTNQAPVAGAGGADDRAAQPCGAERNCQRRRVAEQHADHDMERAHRTGNRSRSTTPISRRQRRHLTCPCHDGFHCLCIRLGIAGRQNLGWTIDHANNPCCARPSREISRLIWSILWASRPAAPQIGGLATQRDADPDRGAV